MSKRFTRKISIGLNTTERQTMEILLEIARKRNPGKRISMGAVLRELLYKDGLENHFSEKELSVLPYHPVNLDGNGNRKRGPLRHPSNENVLIFWQGDK